MQRSLVLPLLGGVFLVLALFVEPAAVLPKLATSWFFSPALLRELRVALGTFGLLCAVSPWILAFLRRTPGTIETQRGAHPRRLSLAVDATFALALIAAAAAMTWRDDPITKDTKFYLGEALDIAQRGGVSDLLARCFDGSWREDNRHPLYLALIAPWASTSNGFLTAARVVSLCGGLATLWLSLRACRRRGGELAAIVAGAVLVTNATFVEHSISVACESWWMACAVAAFDGATRAEVRDTWRRWTSVGACVGLAFLAKGTGTLLFLSIAAWIPLHSRRGSGRRLACVALGFVVVALPLLVRNQLRFGDPLWNLNSRQLFWLDDFQQFYAPDFAARANAQHYFATHSANDVVGRLAMGSIKQIVHALESCAPFSPSAAWGAPVLLALLLAVVCSADRALRALVSVLAAAWFVSFAWYAPVASDRRFLAVLLPIFVTALSTWTLRLGPREAAAVRFGGWLLAFGSIANGLGPAWRWAHTPRFVDAPWNDELRAFLRERSAVDRDALYLLGPSSTLGFDWDREVYATRRARPFDAEQFAQWRAQSLGDRYRYLIVAEHDGPARWGDAWVERTSDGTLQVGRVAAGWTAVASFPSAAPRAVVFERE